MYEGKTPMPDDPSANNPNVALYNSDIANSHGGLNMAPGKGHVPQTHVPGRPDLEDPDLAAAVAILRSHLQAQPSLMVNIPDILSAIYNRFEHANATFQLCSADTDRVNKNVWTMTALKVRITRAKLEKWAELVSHGADHPELGHRSEGDQRMADWQAAMSLSQTECAGLDEMGLFTDDYEQEPRMENNWGQGHTPHTPLSIDLLSGFDPSGLFDGYLDWNSVTMNPASSAER